MNRIIGFLKGFALSVLLLGGMIFILPDLAMAAQNGNPEGDPVRGAELAQPCGACHGNDGMGYSDGIPRISGLSASYLRAQLKMFRHSAQVRAGIGLEQSNGEFKHLKSSARSFSGMDDSVVELTDQDIADLASFFAVQQCKSTGKPQPVKPIIISRCKSCHGEDGMSGSARRPSLASQHAIYIRRQLKFFRAAKKIEDIDLVTEGTTRFNKTMFTHARRLTDNQINDIATYYESLPCK